MILGGPFGYYAVYWVVFRMLLIQQNVTWRFNGFVDRYLVVSYFGGSFAES